MAGVITTTKFWESGNGNNSCTTKNWFRDSGIIPKNSSLNTESDEAILNSTKKILKKSGKMISRTSLLATNPKRSQLNGNDAKASIQQVKKSALLYEITERTNELAKPKNIPDKNKDKNKVETQNRISKHVVPPANERVTELSRPKAVYHQPTKPPNYIAPSALRAVATQRILELATPRKKKSANPKKKNTLYRTFHAPCSTRISYLAKPKNNVKRREAQKNFLRRSSNFESPRVYPPPCDLPGNQIWKELGYSSKVLKRCNKEHEKKFQHSKKIIKPSRSNDSVFSLSLTPKPKKLRLSNYGNKITKMKVCRKRKKLSKFCYLN